MRSKIKRGWSEAGAGRAIQNSKTGLEMTTDHRSIYYLSMEMTVIREGEDCDVNAGFRTGGAKYSL